MNFVAERFGNVAQNDGDAWSTYEGNIIRTDFMRLWAVDRTEIRLE